MKILYEVPFIMLLLLVGCSAPDHLTPEALNNYIQDEDNGLLQQATVNGYTIDVRYKPTDLLVQQEVEGEMTDEKKVETLRNKYNPYYYFMVSLSKNNKEALQVDGNMGQYSDLVQTLSFRMGSYVNLTTAAHDTIPTADFILNRTYGLSDATTLLFVFNKEKAKDKDWVQFNLNEFGLGVGHQRFRFNVKDLEHVPGIDFKVSEKSNAQHV